MELNYYKAIQKNHYDCVLFEVYISIHSSDLIMLLVVL